MPKIEVNIRDIEKISKNKNAWGLARENYKNGGYTEALAKRSVEAHNKYFKSCVDFIDGLESQVNRVKKG